VPLGGQATQKFGQLWRHQSLDSITAATSTLPRSGRQQQFCRRGAQVGPRAPRLTAHPPLCPVLWLFAAGFAIKCLERTRNVARKKGNLFQLFGKFGTDLPKSPPSTGPHLPELHRPDWP